MDDAAKNAGFGAWPAGLGEELRRSQDNGNVGTVLVSETDDLRVWHLILAPGERMPFHKHVLDYFWTVLGDGQGRSYFGDGTVRDIAYRAGDTKHLRYAPGEEMIHNLENTGDTTLSFVTVEFKTASNAPLPLAGL